MNIELSIENINRIVEVINHKSILTAAKNLDVNISTIRRSIKEVESQLNQSLFKRAGNALDILPAAQFIYDQYAKPIYEYTNLISQSTNTLNSGSEVFNILCQPAHVRMISKVLTNESSEINKANIEIFSEYEMLNSEPRSASLIYEGFDCILTDIDIHLINEFNWKISFEKNIPSYFYTTKNYLREHGEININNIEDHNVLIKSFISNTKMILFSESDDKVKIEKRLTSSIESDAIISNVEFAIRGHGIVEIPSYLTEFINIEGLVKIDDIYAMPRKLKLYSKLNLTQNKINIIKEIIGLIT